MWKAAAALLGLLCLGCPPSSEYCDQSNQRLTRLRLACDTGVLAGSTREQVPSCAKADTLAAEMRAAGCQISTPHSPTTGLPVPTP